MCLTYQLLRQSLNLLLVPSCCYLCLHLITLTTIGGVVVLFHEAQVDLWHEVLLGGLVPSCHLCHFVLSSILVAESSLVLASPSLSVAVSYFLFHLMIVVDSWTSLLQVPLRLFDSLG